jgi:hypothetical protein
MIHDLLLMFVVVVGFLLIGLFVIGFWDYWKGVK